MVDGPCVFSASRIARRESGSWSTVMMAGLPCEFYGYLNVTFKTLDSNDAFVKSEVVKEERRFRPGKLRYFAGIHFSIHSTLVCATFPRIFGSVKPCRWRGKTIMRTGTPRCLSALYSS